METADVISLAALAVAVVAAVISGLSWWSGRRSANAATESAAQAVRSADAAERSAAAAEEGVELTREEKIAREEAARTPRFEFGRIDWRGGLLAESAPIRMMSSDPAVRRVDITMIGGTGLGVYGSGVRGAATLTWERPAPLESFVVTFRRPDVDQPVTFTLHCTLADGDGGVVKTVDLLIPAARY